MALQRSLVRHTRGRQWLGHPLIEVEQVEHPVGVDDAHLQHVEPVRKLADRAVQHEDIQDELQDDTEGQVPVRHPLHTEPQQQGDTGGRQHLHHREEDGKGPDGADVGRAVRSIVHSELLPFRGLPPEGLDDVHARHVLLDEDVDARHLVADADEGLLDGLLEDAGGHQKDRDGQEDDDRQDWVNPEHRPDDHDEPEDVADRVQQAVGKDVGDAVNVADVPRDQLSDGRLVEVLEAEARHVLEQGGAQVEGHALGDPVGPVGLPELEQGLDHDQANDQEEDPQQARSVTHGNVVVEGHPNEVGPHPAQAGQQDHEHTRPEEAPAVRGDLLEDAAEDLAVEDLACGFGGAHARKG